MCGGAIAGLLPEYEKERDMGVGAYHGMRTVDVTARKGSGTSRVLQTRGISSPERRLRRCPPAVYGQAALVRKMKKRGVRDVRTGPLGRKREIGEGEVDGAHRGLPKTAAET